MWGACASDTLVTGAPGQQRGQPRPLLALHSKTSSCCKTVTSQVGSSRPGLWTRGGGWRTSQAVVTDPALLESGRGGWAPLIPPWCWRAQLGRWPGSCCQPAVPSWASTPLWGPSFPIWKVGTITPAVISGKFCKFTCVLLLSTSSALGRKPWSNLKSQRMPCP